VALEVINTSLSTTEVEADESVEDGASVVEGGGDVRSREVEEASAVVAGVEDDSVVTSADVADEVRCVVGVDVVVTEVSDVVDEDSTLDVDEDEPPVPSGADWRF